MKCSMRVWRTFVKQDSGFWMAFMFQGRSSVSWSWRTFRATKQQQNSRKCWKNLRTCPRRPLLNNPWAHRCCWDQYWSLPGDLNRKFEHVLHCHEFCSPTLDRQSKAAVCKCVSWAVIEG
jgi:hypothetical protein